MTIKVIQADREAALKPCPFGCEPQYLNGSWGPHDGESAYSVHCNYCGAVGPWDTVQEKAITAWNTRASHADPLRRALEKIAEGDEPRPVGKSWFPDKRVSKHDQCTHGVWMYETCGNCIADFALAALSSGENNNGE